MSRNWKFALWIVAALALVVAYKLLWTTVEPKVDRRLGNVGLTANEQAANGPLPGDTRLYAEELACSQARPTPGYYSSLNAAENTDAERSGVFPCATFTGSFDGPNQVFAWRAATDYQATEYIVNRRPGRDLHRRRRQPAPRRCHASRPLHRAGGRRHRQGDLAHLLPERQHPDELGQRRQPQHHGQRPDHFRLAEQHRHRGPRDGTDPQAGRAPLRDHARLAVGVQEPDHRPRRHDHPEEPDPAEWL